MALSNLLGVALLEQGLDQKVPEVPSNLNSPVSL